MNVTFEFAGETVNAFWNEKTYGNGARYVSVTRSRQSARGTYDANERIWTKRVGSPAYDDAVEAAFGWNKPEDERDENGLTSAERAELEQFYAAQERNADEHHTHILANWKAEQEKPVFFVDKSEETEAIYWDGMQERENSTGTIYTIKTRMPDGVAWPIAGRHSYSHKQAAYRRCRDLNHSPMYTIIIKTRKPGATAANGSAGWDIAKVAHPHTKQKTIVFKGIRYDVEWYTVCDGNVYAKEAEINETH